MHKLAKQDIPPSSVREITVDGATFFVTFGAELGDEPSDKSSCWVDSVKLDGLWFPAIDVFSDSFQEVLDRALRELDEFSACREPASIARSRG